MTSSHTTNTIPLDTEQFWRRSLLTGTASRIAGERLGMDAIRMNCFWRDYCAGLAF